MEVRGTTTEETAPIPGLPKGGTAIRGYEVGYGDHSLHVAHI
jgi:hypothetical protein